MPRILTGSWLDNYLDFVKETESPIDFHLWSAISIIGASLKRKVWLEPGHYKLFPNQYIVLVGPPGIGKGVAMTPAVGIAKKAQTVNFLSDRITAEKIVDKLAAGFLTTIPILTPAGGVTSITESSATIISKELPVFLSTSDWMLPLLCQLWDENEFDYETKNKGSKHIDNLSVGLLAGCVPDYIRRLNKDAVAAVNGGFTARCVFVYGSEKSQKIPWPTCKPDPALEQSLVADLRHMATLGGEFQISDKAKVIYSDYYNKNNIDKFEMEVVANFKSRSPSHILKAAMVLSVAESDNLIIEEEHIKTAIDMIKIVVETLSVTFKGVGESTLVAATSKVQDYIVHKGVVSRSQILRTLQKDVTDEDLTRILTTLEKMGVIAGSMIGGKLCYSDLKNLANVP